MREHPKTRVIAVTSGKGGAGKTTLSLNLAMALASNGIRTCLFDADLGLANVNVLLGLSASKTLEDVVCNRSTLEDVVLRDVHGIDIIPGASGVQQMADLPPEQVTQMLRSFSLLDVYDVILMDTSAGVAKSVIAFCLCAAEVILVINPEPASMTDAYALLKILKLNGFQGRVRVVVSRCKNVEEAKSFFSGFQKTVFRYLDMRPVLLGVVVRDRKVQDAIRKREPVLFRHPGSNASRCIRHIAKSLAEHRPATPMTQSESPFWERWFRLLRAPLHLDVPEEAQAHREAASGSSSSLSRPDATTPLKPCHAENAHEALQVGSPSPTGTQDPVAPNEHELLQELRGIRVALETLASNHPLGPFATLGGPGAVKEGGAMLLDYDAFVKQHRSERRGNPA
ncbi:MAG: MinD/ParA family protein [Desulfobacteraceae bacterium]